MSEPGDWHIDRLEVANFRCFEYLDVSFDPSLTVLVGANGTGKTAVLDALAIMLSPIIREFDGDTRGFVTEDAREVPRDLDSRSSVARMESEYPVWAGVTATLAGGESRWLRERISAKGRTTWGSREVGLRAAEIWRASDRSSDHFASRPPLLPVLALYGVERLVGARKSGASAVRSRSAAYHSALDGKSDLSRLSPYIEALTLADFLADSRGDQAQAARDQLEAIALACNTLLRETGWRDPTWNPIVNGLTLRHEDRGELPLSYLSSGIKIAAGLVIDLVSRMARANPALGAETLLAEVPGVVLIDEIDLHLHPTWQQRIVPLFRVIFPRVQFVVTTHSPQVLSTVEARCIRVLDGTAIRSVQYSAGLRSDVVLAHVMGTRPEPRLAINADLDRYLDLVDRGLGRSDSARELRRRLDEELGGIANVPQLAEADASIAFFDPDE
ncbi:AAA family ATPase [Nocardia takedensis]|uniref:AAA family ATPase n=1 Tax=Nocardia takedensis TaxID=259390 RepID=UPI0012F6CA08|nr:AAA family ATPase [Nocardia takedensis]